MNILFAVIFLFLKTGEKFATQETAGDTVAGLTKVLCEKTGVSFEPRVMNDPVKAAELKGVGVGIVTPGFYLAYRKTLGLEPILEVKRAKVPEERYVLVTGKDAGEADIVTTSMTAEERYVLGVILDGREARLKQTSDPGDALFDIAEGATGGVLLESAQWDAFKDDPELGPKLRVAYRSEALPGNLVVVFRDGADAGKLTTALKALGESDEGKAILRSILVDSFVEIDKPRLAKAEEKFFGK